MKTLQRIFNFTVPTCFLALGVVWAMAQTNGPPDVSTSPLPASQSEFWTFGIAVIAPLIIGGLKKAIPAIPKWALPVSAPFVGLLLGLGLKALGWAELSWVDYGQAGALAVFVRESFNKLVTTPIKGEEGAKTKDTEDIETPDFGKKGKR